MALGVQGDATYAQCSVHLDPGDLLVCYTDGVTDAIDASGQAFGMERLQRVVLDRSHEPAAELMAELEGAIEAFVRDTTPFDDVAIIVLKCC
jgi:sigma-B regulation protein RsbU (phosphoserine phosphatase)